MTEYDYSPEAYERHLAKQASIARWVDNTHEFTPGDPFNPLPSVPDEHGPLTSPAPHSGQSNPAPTYSYYSSESARRNKSRHRRRHSNFTVNSQSTAHGLPLGGGLYTGATQAQLAQPMSAASMTAASISPQNQWFPYASPAFPSTSAIHLPLGSPTQFQAYPYAQQYASPSIASNPQSPYRANNDYGYPAYSASSVQSLPLSTPPSTYVQNPNQPVVVPLNGGGYVILPPGQQVQVISAKDYYGKEGDHETDSDYSKSSFFGSLGGKKRRAPSQNGSRR